MAVGFVMSDTGKTFGMILRNNIIEVTHTIPNNPVAVATVNTLTWKRISVGLTDAKKTILSGDLSIEGSTLKFAQFFSMFDKN